jgi:PAS domain-containing protein
MRRFVLRQNAVRLERALEAEREESLRRSIREMLAACRRELALMEAELLGAQAAPLRRFDNRRWRDQPQAASFRGDFDDAMHPCMVLDPRPGLCITDLNEAHGRATHACRDAVGRPLFEVFPDDPADPHSESVHTLYALLRAAADTGETQTLPAYRYDIRAPDGRFAERYWRSEMTPLIDEDGRLLFLLHKSEDVTAEALAPQRVTDTDGGRLAGCTG